MRALVKIFFRQFYNPKMISLGQKVWEKYPLGPYGVPFMVPRNLVHFMSTCQVDIIVGENKKVLKK